MTQKREVPFTLQHVAAARGERKCVCGLRPEHATEPWAQAIVASWPGNPQGETCPDCGRARIIIQFAFDPNARSDDNEMRTGIDTDPSPPPTVETASPAPPSPPGRTPTKLPGTPESSPPPSDHPERAFRSRKPNRKGALTEGILDAEF